MTCPVTFLSDCQSEHLLHSIEAVGIKKYVKFFFLTKTLIFFFSFCGPETEGSIITKTKKRKRKMRCKIIAQLYQ